MTSFYYNYQNPWVCCFLLQIRLLSFNLSEGLTNLNNKAKQKWILVVVVKYRHCVIVLLNTSGCGCWWYRSVFTSDISTLTGSRNTITTRNVSVSCNRNENRRYLNWVSIYLFCLIVYKSCKIRHSIMSIIWMFWLGNLAERIILKSIDSFLIKSS